jgi:predicted AlkP superfamily pyrophosphatase or phosphodiesterase
MDPVHAAVDLFHRFSNRKVNQKLPKIVGLGIFTKHPQFFSKLYFSPYNFTFRSLFNFYNYN